MLPNQITQLAEGFIQHYDRENPAVIKFRAIRNTVLGSWAKRGFQGFQHGAVIQMGGQLHLFLDKRGRFVWDKLKEILNDTRTKSYEDMGGDLNFFFSAQMHPSVAAAKNYIEQMRLEANAPSGITIESIQSFENILIGFNAEIDLFAAKFAMNEKMKTSAPNIVYYISGDNARVNIDSTDMSINVANSEKIFSELKKTIEEGVEDLEVRARLLTKTDEMEKSVGDKTSYTLKYAEWVALAANHMSIVAPWIPALTQLFTH
jgi:hypothetical protein